MEDLISIIVPIYKVEKYIDKCLESLINQTYKNIEIILVDDGSPDNCGLICDEYAKKDSRIVVIHKENGGLSDARNAGIDIAKGKYISFVDSDDYVDIKYIETLYNILIEDNSDMSMVKQYVVYPNKTINTGTGNRSALTSKETLDKMLYGEDVDVSAWAKLYKRELFLSVRFPKGRLFEDSATTYKLIDLSNRISLYSVPLYYYIMRTDSISNCRFNKKKYDLITSTEEMSNFIVQKYPDLEKGANRRIMYSYLSTLTQLARSDKRDKEDITYLISYIKKNRKDVLKDNRIPKRDKVAIISTYFGFFGFRILWGIYSKYTGRMK